MINAVIISAIILVSLVTVVRIFRKPLRAWAMKMTVKFKIGSLRKAIRQADKIKAVKGRKALVVYDSQSQEFTATEKKVLKKASSVTKNRSNKASTDGRKKMKSQDKRSNQQRVLNPSRIKVIEENSLYVAR